MNSFFFKSLRCALALLTISVSGFVRAQIQESPLDTQILPIGQMFSLIIKGDGESNPPARISADGLPPESVFLRNLDGSRTFIWIPDVNDEGTSSFLVTIADGNDPSLSATYPINLEVVAAAQQPELASSAVTSSSNAASALPDKNTTIDSEDANGNPTPAENTVDESAEIESSAANSLDATQLHTAKVVDIDESKANTDSATTALATDTLPDVSPDVLPENTAATSTTSTVSTSDGQEPVIDPEIVTTEASAIEPADAAIPAETMSANDSDALVSAPDDQQESITTTTNTVNRSANPTLTLPTGLTAVVNTELAVPIRHSSSSGGPSQLRAMNLPQGAVLSEAPDGHILTWTPGSSDTGSTAIILIATDASDPGLSTTRRLSIDVLAQ